MYIASILIVLSIILISLGGLMDVYNKQIIIGDWKPTKEHLWRDGLYLLVLAIALKVIFNVS